MGRVCAVVAAVAVWLSCSPGAIASGAALPRLHARAAALLEADTGQLLYGRHATRELPIASTTKLMTALITLEHARLTTVYADPDFYFAPVDSQIGLVPGERMTVHDLLLALLLPSADDAAQDLAFNVGHGSVSRFIAMMNARARQLGLTRTHYTTPIGLDTAGNYSTAFDLVTLARYDLRSQPFIRHAVDRPSAVLRSGSHVRAIVNRNDLVGRVRWVNGVKTGHTQQAGYVLVGSATRGGMTLISAVLGTPSVTARDAGTLALLNYGFSEFQLRTPVRAGTVITRVHVRYRPRMIVPVVAGSSYTHAFVRGQRVATRAVVPHALNGPLAAGARVGTLLVVAGGAVVASTPLLLVHALAHFKPPAASAAWVAAPITLLSALLLAGFFASTARFRHRKRRARAAQGRRGT